MPVVKVMKSINNKTCRTIVPVEVAGTIAELVSLLGSEEAVVGEVNANYLYRSWNNKFRGPFAEALAAETGVPIPQDGNKTVKRTVNGEQVEEPVLISEDKYAKLLLDGGDISQADLDAIGRRVAATIPVDYTGSTSGRIPKKIEQLYSDLDAKVQAGMATWEGICEKLEGLNPGLTVDPSVTTSIQLALKVNEERKSREAASDLLG